MKKMEEEKKKKQEELKRLTFSIFQSKYTSTGRFSNLFILFKIKHFCLLGKGMRG